MCVCVCVCVWTGLLFDFTVCQHLFGYLMTNLFFCLQSCGFNLLLLFKNKNFNNNDNNNENDGGGGGRGHGGHGGPC